MFFTHDALAKHLHFVLEQRRFKALSPHLVLQGGRHIDPQMLAFQWAIGEHGALQGGGRQPLLSQVLQGLLERCQVLGSQGAACGHRMTTKDTLQAWVHTLRHEAQDIISIDLRPAPGTIWNGCSAS